LFYQVYGGTEDNNSIGCNARTKNTSLTNADCFVTNGGDGFYSRVDPKDPNTIYANMQNGVMVRFDRRTGERISIQPQPAKGDPALRWNRDTPLNRQPAFQHAALFRRAEAVPQRRPARRKPRSHTPARPRQAAPTDQHRSVGSGVD
jgi:hypothetical protein